MATIANACPFCKGKKHVRNNGGWVRCKCYFNEQFVRSLGRDTKEIIKVSLSTQEKNHVKQIHRKYSKGIICFTEGKPLKRWAYAVNLLKLKNSNGIKVSVLRIDDLIDAQFDTEKKKCLKPVVHSPCLWLRLDFGRNHKWKESSINDVLSARYSLLTVITSSDSLRIQYTYRNIILK
jgi:hypothetical protein